MTIEIIILITALCTMSTAIVSLFMSFRNKSAIRDVHISLNSRLSELLKATANSAHAAGMTEEREKPKGIP